MQQNGPTPDVLTFAGNGEPTAHPRFPEIIEDTLALRDKYFPNAKVSVLSNSTFIHRPAVFEALNKIDNNILKLDTVDEEYIRVLDRPTGHYSIREIIEGMKAFKGNCIIQTMFLKGSYKGQDMDNTSDKFVLPWLEAVKEIAPRQVMIYTIDRETPDHDLQKATHEELDRIAERIRETGIPVSVSINNILMKSIAIKDLSENFFEVIGKEWMLVTAGSKEHFNTMTASWGGIGWLWNKPVVFVFILFRALYV